MLKKNFTKGSFLAIFWNFQPRSFSQYPLKNAWCDFFISVKILDSSLVTLIKWVHYWYFLCAFPAISEHWQETFFLESVLLMPEILDYRPVALKKKIKFCKGILNFSKFQNIFSLLSTPRKVSTVKPVQDYHSWDHSNVVVLNRCHLIKHLYKTTTNCEYFMNKNLLE